MTRQGLLHTIIEGAAERLALHPSIPEANRQAFRATAVHVIEQQISAVIGSDTLRITGWAVPPTQRLERRERIERALAAGESVKVIAGRELVSQRHVRRLRADLVLGGHLPP